MLRRLATPFTLFAAVAACTSPAKPADQAPAPAKAMVAPTPPAIYTGVLDEARFDKARDALRAFHSYVEAEPTLLGIVGKPVVSEGGKNYWGYTVDDDHCSELEVDRADDGSIGEVGKSMVDKAMSKLYAHCRMAAGVPLPEPPAPPPEDPDAPGPPKKGAVTFDEAMAGLAHARSKWLGATVTVIGEYGTWSESTDVSEPNGKTTTYLTMEQPGDKDEARLGCRIAGKDEASRKLGRGDLISFTGVIDDEGHRLDGCKWKLVQAAPKHH